MKLPVLAIPTAQTDLSAARSAVIFCMPEGEIEFTAKLADPRKSIVVAVRKNR